MTNEETPSQPSQSSWVMVILSWALVSIPLVWGVWQTVKKAAVLFR